MDGSIRKKAQVGIGKAISGSIKKTGIG